MQKEKDYDENGRVIRANRSAEKRRRNQIKEFAIELIKLPSKQYSLLFADQKTIDAFVEAKRLSNNAYQRHLNYLTRLLDQLNLEELKEKHQRINHQYINSKSKKEKINQEIESLLDQSLALQDLVKIYQEIDFQFVRQMLLAIKKFRQQQENISEAPEHKKIICPQYKKLQKYLSELSLVE